VRGPFGRQHLLVAAVLLALVLVLVPFGAARAFTDVGSTTPYADAIGDLSNRGMISGYPDGTFKPFGSIMRMQLAKMIVRTLALPVSEADVCHFVDVPTGLLTSDPLYPDHYVAVCAAYGITVGKTPGIFAPFDPVSQQQLITMVVRAADLADPPAYYVPPFDSGQFFPFEHYTYARMAAFHGLLEGLRGLTPSRDFSAPATRGEACLLLHNLVTLESARQGADGVVTGVVDGDTISVQLASENESVRLIGLDTPEMGEDFCYEARDALTSLVGGKAVRLETDVEKRDQYGRLLAYVWVGTTLANAELLRLGLATLYTVPPNVRYTDALRAAQDEAQKAGRGIWGGAATSPLRILQVNYDAPGNDNFNLNEEYVVFEVLVAGSLIGYAVEDQSGHRYEFPDRIFQGGEVFKLHTGVGTDSQTDLYWGMTGSAVWNNDGDTVKILDPGGHIVTSHGY